MKKPTALFIAVLLVMPALAQARRLTVQSPDKSLEVTINVEGTLTYSVSKNNLEIIAPSPISMTVNHQTLGDKAVLTQSNQIDGTTAVKPVTPCKRSSAVYPYRELQLSFAQDFQVLFRVYNDGLAYRFKLSRSGPLQVQSEQATFTLSGDYKIFHPEYAEFHSSMEKPYLHENISAWTPGKTSFLPSLVDVAHGPKVIITEADLVDYPGLWLTRDADKATQLNAVFPAWPTKEENRRDRYVQVVERADYIAKTAGPRAFPWRVIGVCEKDGQLLESDLVYRLASPCKLDDVSWIKPGKIAWDWWNDLNVYGVDFDSGVNTQTYKYYIDFAAKYGLEYIILDEGWSETTDKFNINPDVDLHELIRYGKQKNVGIILWCVWRTLDGHMDKYFSAFEEWGAKGVKVDFMNRDDQKMVQYYHRICEKTAQYHLLLDLHGAYKNTGIEKTWPHLLTREGVLGLENCKWFDKSSPEYTVTAPFIRMYAGPMDYTPGAMNNATKKNFRAIYNRPMSLGTRAHQVAMYVIFDSPLQMLCDTPSAYEADPACTSFIAGVPVTWDETIALDAKVSDYILMARRHGSDWFVGAMTDWTPRELTVDFSFLTAGAWKAQVVADGLNADRIGIDHTIRTINVTNETRLTIKLAPGGGWAARITTD